MSNQVTTQRCMFVCVRVVLLTVLIAISQLTLEGDDLAAGSWMRTQE